jgi:hypothetical protein
MSLSVMSPGVMRLIFGGFSVVMAGVAVNTLLLQPDVPPALAKAMPPAPITTAATPRPAPPTTALATATAAPNAHVKELAREPAKDPEIPGALRP